MANRKRVYKRMTCEAKYCSDKLCTFCSWGVIQFSCLDIQRGLSRQGGCVNTVLADLWTHHQPVQSLCSFDSGYAPGSQASLFSCR